MIQSKTSLVASLVLAIVGIVIASDSAEAQRRFQLGGPLGIGIGGGQGLTIGGGYGVQLGGGQGLRFGPPNAGVQYGGGQGVRYGTPNRGVQFGGGQALRFGTPNRGIRIGGGQGAQLGTPQNGLPIVTNNGLQPGQYAAPTQPYAGPTQPYAVQYPQTATVQPVQPYYNNQPQPVYPQAYQPQTYPAPSAPNTVQSVPTYSGPAPATNSVYTPGPSTSLPVVPQNQFDEARQSIITPAVGAPSAISPSTVTSELLPANSADTGTSVLQLD